MDAGKKVFIRCDTVDSLHALKREFGLQLKRFLIGVTVRSRAKADNLLKAAEL